MTKKEFREKKDAIIASMTNLEGEQLAAKQRELNALIADYQFENAEMQREALQPKQTMSANQQLREMVKQVRTHQMDGDFMLKRDSQDIITSGVVASGDLNNMASAGIPITIKELINPMEMGLVYDKLGMNVATGVRGQMQWPYLANAVEVSVGGELDDAATATLDFGKIEEAVAKLGISIEVSNEAINDEAFDLKGTILTQMNKAVGRVLNKRTLALSAPSAKPSFVGPLVSHKQTTTSFGTAGEPTYAEVKALKGQVLGTGAEMAGFLYIMDAAMFSKLETTPKDAGSGRFVIENGNIDGDPVFLTADTAYAGKIAAGCFAYEALNQKGEAHLVIDPYTKAKKNVTVFTLNADWAFAYLVDPAKPAPFAVGA